MLQNVVFITGFAKMLVREMACEMGACMHESLTHGTVRRFSVREYTIRSSGAA